MEKLAQSSLVIDVVTETAIEIAPRLVCKPDDPLCNIRWGASKAHPNGATFHGWFATIENQANVSGTISGTIDIKGEDLDAFEAAESFVMFKVVGRVKPGQYVGLGMYDKEPMRLDSDSPKEDGRWLYSLPQHKMSVGTKRFWFVVRITVNGKDANKVDFQIDRAQLMRFAAGKLVVSVTKEFGRKEVALDAIAEILKASKKDGLVKLMTGAVTAYHNLG